mgnify:CR=1 FL=1
MGYQQQFQPNFQPQMGAYQQPQPQQMQPSFGQAMQGYSFQQPQQLPVQQQPIQIQQQPYTLTARIVASRDEALSGPPDPLTGYGISYDPTHETVWINVLDRATGVTKLHKFVEAPSNDEPSLTEISERLKAIEDEFALAKKRGAVTASKKGAVDGD